jgi:hypothetical protein
MTRGGTDRRNTCLRAARAIQRSQLDLRAARAIRRSLLYGDSPASQSFVPITSALFESCLRNPTRSQLEQRLASSIRGTAMRLPFGSTVESWLPRPSACPRPSPYAVPRVDGASRHRSQALEHSCERRHCASSSQTQLRASALREQLLNTALSLGIAGKKLFKHLAECCSRIELRENS